MSPGSRYRCNNAFRCAIAALMIAFGSVLTAPALALTRQDIDRCVGKNATPDLQIKGCTAVIHSGKVSGSHLAAAYHDRGIAHARRGDFELAIADFNEAIQLNPQSAYPYSDRGLTYARR